jgi:hypothetical protein
VILTARAEKAPGADVVDTISSPRISEPPKLGVGAEPSTVRAGQAPSSALVPPQPPRLVGEAYVSSGTANAAIPQARLHIPRDRRAALDLPPLDKTVLPPDGMTLAAAERLTLAEAPLLRNKDFNVGPYACPFLLTARSAEAVPAQAIARVSVGRGFAAGDASGSVATYGTAQPASLS